MKLEPRLFCIGLVVLAVSAACGTEEVVASVHDQPGPDAEGDANRDAKQDSGIDDSNVVDSTSDSSGDAPRCPDDGGTPVTVIEPEPRLTAGAVFYCGLDPKSNAVCWPAENRYVLPTPPDKFLRLSAGVAHVCGIRADGTIGCWGRGTELNDCGTPHDLESCGQALPPTGTFLQVSAGFWHTCGIRTNGTVECWGANDSGQSDAPCGRFVQVVSGSYETCGFRETGELVCWGRDLEFPPADYRQVALGLNWHCGIRRGDDELYCRGWFRDPFTPPMSPPTLHEFLIPDVLSASAGDSAACWLLKDGTVSCAGVYPLPDEHFTEIVVGYNDGCGVTTAGTATCWGSDGSGETVVPTGFVPRSLP